MRSSDSDICAYCSLVQANDFYYIASFLQGQQQSNRNRKKGVRSVKEFTIKNRGTTKFLKSLGRLTQSGKRPLSNPAIRGQIYVEEVFFHAKLVYFYHEDPSKMRNIDFFENKSCGNQR